MSGKKITLVSELVGLPLAPTAFLISSTPENRYVSRGGLKLEAALAFLLSHYHWNAITELRPDPLIALDIGISTGGFTDCLLQAGVPQVWGVDVGHGQLDPRLDQDPRVTHFEGLNARDLSAQLQLALSADTVLPVFDLIVIDVAFISLKLILPPAWSLLGNDGILIALVKPQFELGASALDKRGVVKDPKLYQNLELAMREWSQSVGAEFVQWMESPILGGDGGGNGNHEFLMILRKREFRKV